MRSAATGTEQKGLSKLQRQGQSWRSGVKEVSGMDEVFLRNQVRKMVDLLDRKVEGKMETAVKWTTTTKNYQYCNTVQKRKNILSAREPFWHCWLSLWQVSSMGSNAPGLLADTSPCHSKLLGVKTSRADVGPPQAGCAAFWDFLVSVLGAVYLWCQPGWQIHRKFRSPWLCDHHNHSTTWGGWRKSTQNGSSPPGSSLPLH